VWGEERSVQGFVGGNQNERDHLGDIGLDRMIILKWIFGKCDAVLWTGTIVAQDSDRRQEHVNAVMNIRVL
jgi:hypothetical protein